MEAARLNHNYLGTEHLLLGLIRPGEGVAVNVLQKMGIDLETLRMEGEKLVGTCPDREIVGNIPYSPRAKKVLALAGKEAKSLDHSYVGTEHILLGLLGEGEGVAAHVLKNLEVDIERTRNEILKELNPNFIAREYEQVSSRIDHGLSESMHAAMAARRIFMVLAAVGIVPIVFWALISLIVTAVSSIYRPMLISVRFYSTAHSTCAFGFHELPVFTAFCILAGAGLLIGLWFRPRS
jgi:hypothetical protein